MIYPLEMQKPRRFGRVFITYNCFKYGNFTEKSDNCQIYFHFSLDKTILLNLSWNIAE